MYHGEIHHHHQEQQQQMACTNSMYQCRVCEKEIAIHHDGPVDINSMFLVSDGDEEAHSPPSYLNVIEGHCNDAHPGWYDWNLAAHMLMKVITSKGHSEDHFPWLILILAAHEAPLPRLFPRKQVEQEEEIDTDGVLAFIINALDTVYAFAPSICNDLDRIVHYCLKHLGVEEDWWRQLITDENASNYAISGTIFIRHRAILLQLLSESMDHVALYTKREAIDFIYSALLSTATFKGQCVAGKAGLPRHVFLAANNGDTSTYCLKTPQNSIRQYPSTEPRKQDNVFYDILNEVGRTLMDRHPFEVDDPRFYLAYFYAGLEVAKLLVRANTLDLAPLRAEAVYNLLDKYKDILLTLLTIQVRLSTGSDSQRTPLSDDYWSDLFHHCFFVPSFIDEVTGRGILAFSPRETQTLDDGNEGLWMDIQGGAKVVVPFSTEGSLWGTLRLGGGGTAWRMSVTQYLEGESRGSRIASVSTTTTTAKVISTDSSSETKGLDPSHASGSAVTTTAVLQEGGAEPMDAAAANAAANPTGTTSAPPVAAGTVEDERVRTTMSSASNAPATTSTDSSNDDSAPNPSEVHVATASASAGTTPESHDARDSPQGE